MAWGNSRSRAVFNFHQPEELIRLAKLDNQVRTLLRQMPPLDAGRLWPVQIESIKNLEASLADNRPRALNAAKYTPTASFASS